MQLTLLLRQAPSLKALCAKGGGYGPLLLSQPTMPVTLTSGKIRSLHSCGELPTLLLHCASKEALKVHQHLGGNGGL